MFYHIASYYTPDQMPLLLPWTSFHLLVVVVVVAVQCHHRPQNPAFPPQYYPLVIKSYWYMIVLHRLLFRRRTIAVPDGFRGFRVLPPFALLPVGLTG